MCGIIAVVRRPPRRAPPSGREITDALGAARAALPDSWDPHSLQARLEQCAAHVESAELALRGTPGVTCLLADPAAASLAVERLGAVDWIIERLEADLDRGTVTGSELEHVNRALVRVKDAVWAVRHDRLRTAAAVRDLAGPRAGRGAVESFTSVQVALSALDRLEVRGRDSAGLHVLVRDHGLDLGDPAVRSVLAARTDDSLFRSGAVRTPGGHLAFVYKAAAEIGELGDNARALRTAIRDDELLSMALENDDAHALVLGHTRWASVGMISEANAHPLTSEEDGRADGPYLVAALNGDVDNYADLKAAADLRIPTEITTDAKVIPVLVSRRALEGASLDEAFRATVASFDGSVAIAAVAADAPGTLMCALRGSGQALYVGLAEDAFVVASEPYGLVEQSRSYIRMDGETPAERGDPSTRGQIVILDETGAGTLDGVRRIAYNGRELPVTSDELQIPEITTRDIDRGPHPHFLLKEITESPRSFRKTLRGKLVERKVVLGPETLPPMLCEKLARRAIRRILVIGQGTAAVAARSAAAALERTIPPGSATIEATTATELSGFRLTGDMADTLVIAVSQSGTTTDTNRTVDLVRARGASVISIVNRRNSDLTDRSDGVLYTSDGRDVEMAVPSTKAFYAQVAAGFLLAFAVAQQMGAADDDGRAELLDALRTLPDAMETVLARREHIAGIAQRHAPSRRYWAVVGNGMNRVAAEEVRIKLSELCYKSIACDVTEDKKHIDLSSEPLILVCAAGLYGSNADDVAKEVAIYRAHKAAPLVIASEGEARFQAALDVMWVPAVHPDLAFVLSAMAGHVFGYEAALAIDAQARPLREARAAIEAAVSRTPETDGLFERLSPSLAPIALRFFEDLRGGSYDGHLEASTAVHLASLLRYAAGVTPLDAYQIEHGKVGTPSVLVQDLTEALTRAIDELTRPIDAIKHQAKTVTVGISRTDETLLQVGLVQAVLEAGVARDRLGYRALRTLAALDAAVERVTGFLHYRIEGDVARGTASIHVVDRGGISADLPSRTDRDPTLRGTKSRAASEREVMVARGHDGRTLILVPEVKGAEVTGLALIHANFRDRLPPAAMRAVLERYRDRYAALRDAVTETEPTFRDDILGDVAVFELLTQPVYVLAQRWRSS
jgi:glucosamine--fructose-6-phosphate aminotransferase (isomerizing)